jgi:hypothetical protein
MQLRRRYGDQEKEFPRGEPLCPLFILHSSLKAERKPLACNEQGIRDKASAVPRTARQKTFFLTSIEHIHKIVSLLIVSQLTISQ